MSREHPRPALRAVLFDMDGTLVQTEHYWGEAMSELAGRLGGRMSSEARSRTVGTSMRTSMQVLHADLGVVRNDEQVQDDARWVEARAAQLMVAGVAWQPGARDLLASVRAAGLMTALVTTTPRRVARIVLEAIRSDLVSDPFDVTVCGDEVPALKPDPAPYRQAMAALGVQPRECLVVEDSLAGIGSGLAAGVVVVGVPDLQSVAPAAGLRLLDSLLGVDVDRLVDLHAGRDLDPADA